MSTSCIKCTNYKNTAGWAKVGEENFFTSLKACDRRVSIPTHKKRQQLGDGPQEFSAGDKKILYDKIEEQPQRISDYHRGLSTLKK